jgi:hypothetical protein
VIQRLQLRNFKSWREADIEFGSITIFFGANSSGKTALLQFLLLLKQTVEHPDPTIPLFWGDERSPVELGRLLGRDSPPRPCPQAGVAAELAAGGRFIGLAAARQQATQADCASCNARLLRKQSQQL